MSSEDKESQEDELLALASIYDEDEFKRAQDVQGGETRISVAVPQNFRVSLSGKSNSFLDSDFLERYSSTVLPNMEHSLIDRSYFLTTCLPQSYASLCKICKWLSQAQLTALCRHLDNLWEENRGSVVLFAWMQFLKEETLAFLNITSPFEPEITEQEKQPKEEDGCYDIRDAASAQKESSDTSTVEDVESLSILIKEILDFDQSQKEKNFNCKMFTCNICFSVKQGSECMDFKDCRHVYCKICLKNYFEIQIKDGQVHCLNCPEPECSSVATPGQVKELVEEKLFALYDRLLLQSSLDLMADVVYCPRPSCQTPVMQDPSCTMGICSQCNYAFCTLCKMTYHGVSPCKVTAEKLADLRNEYLQADEATQRFLEQRYGKRVIQKALEEMESKKWLENNSKSCPCCSTPIEKLNGCNRMRCTACMQYFCWLCMGVLSRINPYKHFSDPDSPCFNLLFQAMEIED
ncbi:E3 ubiquitin-protein ligase RNF14, partial [Ophiophagus hannah]